MRRGPSRARLISAWADLNLQVEARYSSTKSENFHLRLKLPSYAFCRSTSLNVLAALAESTLTFESSQQPIVTCRPLSVLGLSVTICFTACMFSRLRFLLFENEKRTFPCWLTILSIATPEKLVRT